MVSTQVHPATGHVHLLDVVQRPRWLQKWERLRRGKFSLGIECIAEFFGVFFYVYLGVGATLTFNVANLTQTTGISSLLNVGLAYALGIVFAVAICAPVSGGHFNPCITISKAVWRSFPWKKVLPFIISQIAGGFFACMSVYSQNRGTILILTESLIASGKYDAIQFTPQGLAGAFGLYLPVGGNVISASFNEFSTDFFLGLVIWAISDPTNFFIPPVAAPWIVGFAYGVAIWNFAPGGLAANSARDLGGRFMAMTVWGSRASGGIYAVVAALTNIPATLFASLIYELVFTDSSRVLPPAQVHFLSGHKAQLEHSAMGETQRNNLVAGIHDSTDKVEISPVVQSAYSV